MSSLQETILDDFSGGMNDTIDPILLKPNELADCRNVYINNGRLETRPGYSELHDIGAVSVKSIYNFTKQDGTQILLAHTGTAMYKSTDGVTWTAITITDNDAAEMTLTATAQVSYVTFQNKVFFFNGVDRVWSYDGTNTFVYDRDLDPGYEADGGTTTTLIDAAVTNGDDYWKNFKLYFLSDDTQNFELSRVLTGWTQGTNTFAWTDAVEVAPVSGESYYVGPDIPKGAYACVCQGRIFAVMRSDDNVHYCERDDYWRWPSTNYFATEVGLGQRNTGCANYMGQLVIFKEKSIFKYDVSNAFPESWTKQLISHDYGCVFHNSIRVLAINGIDHLIWVSKDGICIMGPNWQVQNLVKDRLEKLWRTIQIPTYNYLQWIKTTTADFNANASNTDISVANNEFTLANGSKTYDDNADFTEAGYAIDGLKSSGDKLEIDFTEGSLISKTDVQNGDSWIQAGDTEATALWQTISRTGGLFPSQVKLYLKNSDNVNTVVAKCRIEDEAGGSIFYDEQTLSAGAGAAWVTFTIGGAGGRLKSDASGKIKVWQEAGSDVGQVEWYLDEAGGYTGGRSDQHADYDYFFDVYGYPAGGSWTSAAFDTGGYTNGPVFGVLSVSETYTSGTHGIIYEIASSDTSPWPGDGSVDWYEMHNGQRILPGSEGGRYVKVRVKLTTKVYNSSPEVDDLVIVHSASLGTAISNVYHQTSSFDEYGVLDVTQVVPADASAEWYIHTDDDDSGWLGYKEIDPGGVVPTSVNWDDSYVQWQCILRTSNASNLPSVQDVTVNWLDWTSGSTLTAIGNAAVWDDRYLFSATQIAQSSSNMVIVVDGKGAIWPWNLAMDALVKFRDYLYGGDTNGKIHRMGVGYSDNGSAYTGGAYIVTRAVGTADRNQVWRLLKVLTEKIGNWNLTVQYAIDPRQSSPTFTTLGTVGLVGVGTLLKTLNFVTSNDYVGQYIRFKLITSVANNPWYLYGLTIYHLPYTLRGEADTQAAEAALPQYRFMD